MREYLYLCTPMDILRDACGYTSTLGISQDGSHRPSVFDIILACLAMYDSSFGIDGHHTRNQWTSGMPAAKDMPGRGAVWADRTFHGFLLSTIPIQVNGPTGNHRTATVIVVMSPQPAQMAPYSQVHNTRAELTTTDM